MRAPTAIRRPISRVRSVTETSMMFMIPIPPTSRLTEATLMRRPVMVWASWPRIAAISSTVRTEKSSSSGFGMRWRWRRRRVIWTAVSSTVSARVAETMICVSQVMPEQLLLDRGVGGHDDVVLVVAPLALALGGEHAHDAEGEVLDADDLARRGPRPANRFWTTVAPSRQTLSATSTSRAVKLAPSVEGPAPHGHVVLVAALHRGIPVQVPGHHLGAARAPPG